MTITAALNPSTLPAAHPKSGALWEFKSSQVDANGEKTRTYRLYDRYDDLTPHPDIEARLQAARNRISQIFPADEPTGSRARYLYPDGNEKQLMDLFSERAWNESYEDFRKSYYATLKTSMPYGAQCLPASHPAEASLQREAAALLDSARINTQLHLKLHELGYQLRSEPDGVYFTMPTRKTLQARWERLRQSDPRLSELKITSSKGIASDWAYFQANLTCDVLISSHGECIHDTMIHVLSRIEKIFFSGVNGDPTYEESKARFDAILMKAAGTMRIARILIHEGSSKISKDQLRVLMNHFEKLEAALGSMADMITADSRYKSGVFTYENDLDHHFRTIWDAPGWKESWARRFPGEKIDGDEILKTWKFLQEFERKYNVARALEVSSPKTTFCSIL